MFVSGVSIHRISNPEVLSAKGAAFILSLGHRPRIRGIVISSAVSAIHFIAILPKRRLFDEMLCLGPVEPIAGLNHAFSAPLCHFAFLGRCLRLE